MVSRSDPALKTLPNFDGLQADSPLKSEREDGVEQQVADVVGLPGLVTGDPQGAVAHVVVHAEDVGVLVVLKVVGGSPVLGRPTHVPFPCRGVDLGIVHPVPLAVHDVVADLHVLDDLGQTQRHGSRPPCRAFRATGQHEPAGYLESALRGDGAADVARVALATGILDVQPDRVQLNGQILDVGVGQVSEGRNVSDRHRLPFLSGFYVGPAFIGNEEPQPTAPGSASHCWPSRGVHRAGQ